MRGEERPGGTLPETNIAPENQPLEDEISFWNGPHVQILVSGSVSRCVFHQWKDTANTRL